MGHTPKARVCCEQVKRTSIPLIDRKNIHTEVGPLGQEINLVVLIADDVAPLTRASRQAHRKVVVATRAVHELCVGTTKSAVSLVLVETFEEESLIHRHVGWVTVWMHQLVVEAAVHQQAIDTLDDIGGKPRFVVGEQVFDQAPLRCALDIEEKTLG